jgi:transcription elongation factor Elf1
MSRDRSLPRVNAVRSIGDSTGDMVHAVVHAIQDYIGKGGANMDKRIGEHKIVSMCPRCKKERDDVHFMWDCMIDGKMQLMVDVCEACDIEMHPRPCQHEWCKYTDNPGVVVCAECGKEFGMIDRKEIKHG